MKRLLIIITILCSLLFPQKASAQTDWQINQFLSGIEILPSGIVEITETINVDFFNNSKHGIFRDIPYIYSSDKGETYTRITVRNVLQNGQPAKFQKSENGSFINLKIGDPDRTITGVNTYTINYTAEGILKSFEEYDELYWNVTGNNWDVDILSAKAQVILPFDSLLKSACFQGPAGSTDNCSFSQIENKFANFASTRSLMLGEGLTVVVGFQKGMVPILSVERPPSMWEKFISWPSQITLFTALTAGIGTVLFLWFKYGRDYWFAGNLFSKKTDSGTVKPVGVRETISVEFTPPDNLRPAEIGVIMDEYAHTHDVTSTIIDLAGRGFLTIAEIPKKWLFGSIDYALSKTAKSHAGLLGYEKKLLEKLFNNRDSVKISDLKTTFYEELKEIKNELYTGIVSRKYFPSNPDQVRTKYFIIAIITISLGFFAGFFSLSLENIYIADISLGAIISGIILAGASSFMPRKTAYGRETYRRILGYKMFINSAEKYRQQFFEKKNLFNEVLPYAIVFGLTEKFAKAMKDIGLETAKPAWYTGAHPFNTHVFASSINSFSSSMSGAIASAPKSSGFSGGGGYSGGGFGGGGGGSW